MAVDLCKVALWIEGLCCGVSLNFLDHRIKNGNSLVGVLDLDCLKEGIPDNAYKPVTGDDKSLATQFKKRNKQERESKAAGQLALTYDNIFERDREEYAKAWREIEGMKDDDPTAVRQKQEKYERSRHLYSWQRDKSACNLWAAAFFMPLTEQNLQLLPTSGVLDNLLKGNWATQEIVAAADRLADEKHFFHWPLEFPEVFEQGGFNCVLGNPPWERIKLQEKEFFAARDFDISNAANKSAREKLIRQLPITNPALEAEWKVAKHDAEAQGKFIRESQRFTLTATGDINTYAVFSETTKDLISNHGKAGLIIPTGIVSDDTTKVFFQHLIKNEILSACIGFENEDFIFSSIANVVRFCLFILGKGGLEKSASPRFAFYIRKVSQASDQERFFSLSKEEIALLNPNTLTCPVFRTSTDADLTKKIYRHVPVLQNEATGENPWSLSFMRMFDMSNDSGLFKAEAGEECLPLYEAKMFWHYDHRWGDYANDARTTGRGLAETSLQLYQDPCYRITPRYWVPINEVEGRLEGRWRYKWLLGWRDITSAKLVRTSVFGLIPLSGCGDTVLLMFPSLKKINLVPCLLAASNSLVVISHRNKAGLLRMREKSVQ